MTIRGRFLPLDMDFKPDPIVHSGLAISFGQDQSAVAKHSFYEKITRSYFTIYSLTMISFNFDLSCKKKRFYFVDEKLQANHEDKPCDILRLYYCNYDYRSSESMYARATAAVYAGRTRTVDEEQPGPSCKRIRLDGEDLTVTLAQDDEADGNTWPVIAEPDLQDVGEVPDDVTNGSPWSPVADAALEPAVEAAVGELSSSPARDLPEDIMEVADDYLLLDDPDCLINWD